MAYVYIWSLFHIYYQKAKVRFTVLKLLIMFSTLAILSQLSLELELRPFSKSKCF